ncbi:MAG: hypothetical protein MJ052_05870 [Sphaerochaetaceae bacterium]|nr:hypothetical protein [Sphaerochaetaceae bacterium]
MRKICETLILILFILLAFSCKREDFAVTSLLAQPYITSDGTMGLSVYTDSNIPGKKTQMQVESPDKVLVWNLNAETVEYDGLTYHGSADITMPDGVVLPQGMWTVTFFCSDGRSSLYEFNVNYTDTDGEESESVKTEEEDVASEENQQPDFPYFNPETNLTYLR